MATLTKGTESKEKLMDAAIALMIEKGFAGTSVDEICEEAGVNRGSFFYYFKTKEDLAKEILVKFSQKMGGALCDARDCCGEDPLERVYGWIDATIALSKNPDAKGCLVGTLAQEISETHPELRAVCQVSFEKAAEAIEKDLTLAKEKYAKKRKIDVHAVAEAYVAIAQGSMILAKAKKDKKVMERMLTQYKLYLKELFGR